jgi:hypothetical protein
MSKHLLSFLLTELSTVRIICKGPKDKPCGAVVEVPLEKLSTYFQNTERKCPYCENIIAISDQRGNSRDAFGPFRDAVENLKQCSENFEVEFIIPAPPPGSESSG